MRPGRVSVAAGIAVAAIGCAIAAAQSSSDPGRESTAAVATPAPSPSVSSSATPTPTPVQAAGATTGPGGCSIAAPPSPPSGLALYVCYTITGTVSASGGFIDEEQGAGAFSCADWAQDGEEPAGSAIHALQAPDPGDAQVEVDGQLLGFDLAIEPYSGPGSYRSIAVAQSVSVGAGQSWSTNSAPLATFSAQVSADGSGSLTVTDLHDNSSNGTTESASESWVCAMAAGS